MWPEEEAKPSIFSQEQADHLAAQYAAYQPSTGMFYVKITLCVFSVILWIIAGTRAWHGGDSSPFALGGMAMTLAVKLLNR